MRQDNLQANNQALIVNKLDEIKAKAGEVFDLLDVSENTRADYASRISLFLDFLQKTEFSNNSFREFKRELADRVDISVSTKNKYLATARVFLKELNRQGFLPVDITQNTKAFSQDKKHKRDGVNDREMTLLVDTMAKLPQTANTARITAILSLLALQGLRQVEIVRLDVKDIDFVRQVLFVQGKGRDDKEPVYLHPETVKALKVYLQTSNIADGALFVSQSNNSKNQRLTTRALRGLVKQVLDDLGIEKTTHGFRHYFTTKLIQNYKGDLLEVARYTRHRSIEMLQVYNDNIKSKADLPRYYNAFSGVNFTADVST